MYLTYVKSRIQKNTDDISNIIDELFAGNTEVELPEVSAKIFSKKVTVYIDNLTEQSDIHTNVVTYEQLLCVLAKVRDIHRQHPEPEQEYINFKIPKKTHGFREISAPKPALKRDLKIISNLLSNYLQIEAHDSAWAYTPGRDVVGAMQEHTNNNSRWYLKLDLHNFFGSCSPEFIKEQLLKLYPFAYFEETYPEVVNEILDKIIFLACKDGGLPQGTPLSPLLTNLIMTEFDYNINKLFYKLSKRNEGQLFTQKYIYTRYADDIIISARNKFDYKYLVEQIKQLIDGTPLELNVEKTRFGSASGRNWNLGLMCNKDYKITVGYKRKQHLKSIVNNYIKDKEAGTTWNLEDLYWLQGQFSWLKNVEPDYYKGFNKYLEDKYQTNIPESIIADIKSYN